MPKLRTDRHPMLDALLKAELGSMKVSLDHLQRRVEKDLRTLLEEVEGSCIPLDFPLVDKFEQHLRVTSLRLKSDIVDKIELVVSPALDQVADIITLDSVDVGIQLALYEAALQACNLMETTNADNLQAEP